jgi:HD-GYP domain-containing protein (c-di-GMP phosphodiesterase class II)
VSDAPARPARKGGENQLALASAIGPQLLIRLAALIRTGRTHDVANQAFQRQLHDCLGVLQKLLEAEHDAALAAASGYFYLNGVRIRASASLLPVYHALMGELERRGIGGIRFAYGLTAPELERFFQLFVAADDPTVAGQVLGDLQAANIDHIALIGAAEIQDEEVTRTLEERGDASSERGRAQRVFWRAVLGTKKILLRVQKTGRPDLRHAKRLVQPFVDQIMNHEYSIVGLTAMKDHDEYTYAHCVNVSIMSVSIGHVLELPRQTLADLGVAALLHDVGKLTVPGSVLRKAAKLDEREWRLMHRHPLEGVKMMFRMPGLSTLTVDAMRCCFEHHMNANGTGYPRVSVEWKQGSMSRIVAIADCFDAMTAHRAYHDRPFTPYEALHYLLGKARESFDPAVRWALVRTVGLYPPGTVMITSSGTAVLSMTPNPDDLTRPHCRVLVHPDGGVEPDENGETWSPMPAHEQVVRVLRPEDLQISTADYLAA